MGKPIVIIEGNALSSKNSRPIFVKKGKPFIGKSRNLTKQMESYYWQCVGKRLAFQKALKQVQPPYNILFRFYRKTRQKFDYGNLAQGIADALVKSKCIVDDNAEIFRPFYEHYYDNKRPRIEIFLITKVEYETL